MDSFPRDVGQEMQHKVARRCTWSSWGTWPGGPCQIEAFKQEGPGNWTDTKHQQEGEPVRPASGLQTGRSWAQSWPSTAHVADTCVGLVHRRHRWAKTTEILVWMDWESVSDGRQVLELLLVVMVIHSLSALWIGRSGSRTLCET